MKEQNQDKQPKKQKGDASPKHMSVKSILGGDILANDFFKEANASFDFDYGSDHLIHKQPI